MRQNVNKRGFTLIEASFVLIIVGAAMMAVYPALATLRQTQQIATTQSNLQSLLHMTAAYVQAHGCLPCPTPPTATGARFGTVGGGGPACGVCATPEGLVPFVGLGLSAAMAKDGWGRWITMRIDPALAVNADAVVPPTMACTAADVAASTCATIGASQKGFCKAGLSTANTHPLVQMMAGPNQAAAVVFVSHGPNGFGSMTAPSSTQIYRLGIGFGAPPTCAQGPEACNASYTRQFSNWEKGSRFDDWLTYVDRNALVSLLGQGSCQTAW